MALTRRQRQVLDVIREFIDRNGYSPSLEEIATTLGLSSVATVHKHVSHLVEKGHVRRSWNQNRSIEPVTPDPEHGEAAFRLPLRGSIAAGAPLEAIETSESIGVPADMVRRPADSFVLRVQGDSMIDEQIRDGDYVVVEKRETAQDGETVVALVDDTDATLKRFFHDGDTIRLEPANPAVPTLRRRPDQVKIQGVVVGVIRKY
ncbi:MAG: transcriptional repressor LexA [Acidobacteria bacterium]|nr:MAG: transcriptional repressor LexA [Acidobacteriota bacterium]